MFTKHNPGAIHRLRYVHGVEVRAGARWLHLSGQIGVNPDGTRAEGIEAQMERAWLNVFANLESAGMGPENMVKIIVYLVDREYVPVYREARDRMLGDAEPASTVVIADLVHPDLLVEIDVVAAAL